MSGVRKSTPPTSSPIASHGAHRHLAVVGVHDVGHVDRGAAGREVAGASAGRPSRPAAGTVVAGVALLLQQPLGLGVELEPGQHLLVADAAPRVAVDDRDQLLDRVAAVAHHVARHPLGHRDELAVDHQHPVVVAPDEALDDHAPAVLLRLAEGRRAPAASSVRWIATPRPWLALYGLTTTG